MISQRDKFKIFRTLIISKLLYGLDSSWLNKYDRKRLDGFFANCCRRIIGVAHSYYSRISNKTILTWIGTVPLSHILLERQLQLYRKISIESRASKLRSLIFESDFNIKMPAKRSRGRPRNSWTYQIHKHATQILNQHGTQILQNNLEWKSHVRAYCRCPHFNIQLMFTM